MTVGKKMKHLAAWVLAVAGGIALLIATGILTADTLATHRELPADTARVDELTQRSVTNAEAAADVHAEFDRQTQVSLERNARAGELSRIILIAAIAFLAGCKWIISLRDRPACLPARLRALIEERSARLAAAAEPSEAHDHVCTCATSQQEEEKIDPAFIDETIERIGRTPECAIPILHAIQTEYNYLPEAAIQRVSERTEMTAAQLTGVASFYAQFRHTPRGQHLIKVCTGTACHVAGAPRLTDELRRQLQLPPGQDTDLARRFTLEEVACLGCCTLAPVVQVDDRTYGHMRTDAITDMLADAAKAGAGSKAVLKPSRIGASRVDGLPEILIGLGSCCIANGSGNVHAALNAALDRAGIAAHVKRVGCVGMCHQTPLVEIRVPGRPAAHYAKVVPELAETIVRRHLRPDGMIDRARFAFSSATKVFFDGKRRDEAASRMIHMTDRPVAAFLNRQKHIATEHCGDIDPTDLDEYLKHDGFAALRKCLQSPDPEGVIETIRLSGLSGRGGAGFPTATKWARVRQAWEGQKYVICNGDEGDPGAFMDRMLMESYPYRIIEGVAIAAFAVGATEGYFYIRNEYPLAVKRIREAILKCEERGFLGDACFGTNHRLHLHIMEGAGAFVCGEETALIASIEGKRGMPTLRPPYPADHGLWGRPTLVNNAETYASVAWIIRNGADAFAALGTETSKGTKVFSLAGKIRNGGLIEVPMGITIREIVHEIGGGIKEGKAFKAVQIGGPSGGCVPQHLADTPVDFQALTAVGAIMGSGGLVVLDETDCMVDIARYFLAFTQGQSCGKCTPCRVGTRRMLEILDRLCEGKGQPGDAARLEELAHSVKKGSLCGLGKTAPNPVLTTLQYFHDEYEAHIEGRCPAGKCKALIRYEVTDQCTGCTLCAQHCAAGAIDFRPYAQHEIDMEKCTRCDVCRVTCPEDAIRIVSG